MKTILWVCVTSLLLNSYCYAQIRAKAADSAEAIEAIQRQQQDRIEADREIQEKRFKEHKQAVEAAKQKNWLPTDKTYDPTILRGTWVEGEGKQRTTFRISADGKGNDFKGRGESHNPDPKIGVVQWKVTGTISPEGHVTMKVDVVKAPRGWVGQTRIGTLSPDGNSIKGTSIVDNSATPGGLLWVREGKQPAGDDVSGEPDSAPVIPSVSGAWWEGDSKDRIAVTISQKDDQITAQCTYQHPQHGEIRWKFLGKVTNKGILSGHLVHTKSPKGWTGQRRTAVVSADGNTISGKAVFDTGGGHDFIWKRDEQTEPAVSTAEIIGTEGASTRYKTDSPETAGGYLERLGLKTGRYQNSDGDDYFATSPYKNIGTGTPPCNLSYNVEGTANSVKAMYLTLSVNNPKGTSQGHAELLAASQELIKKATGTTLPQEAKRGVEEGKKGEWKVGEALLKVERMEFTGTLKGYRVTFRIE